MSTEEIVDEIIATLIRYAEANIKRQQEDDNQDVAVLDKIQEHIAYYCKSTAKRETVDVKFKDCIEKIQQASSTEDAAKICVDFGDELTTDPPFDAKSDERYKKFLALRNNQGDETILVVKSTQNFIDPLSKKRMVNPVKNSQCGHSYEQSVALAVLKRNPRTRCPMMGCSAFIEKKHLVLDEELKKHLAANPEDAESDEENSKLVALDDSSLCD